MLLGNYSVLNRNPIRYLGGSTVTPECNHQAAMKRGGMRKNRQYVEQTTAANKQFSLPYGSYPPYMTLLPQVGGNLAARRSSDFGITPTGTGGLGMPGDGTATIGIDTNTPAGQLVTTVLAGGAPATFGIDTNVPLLTASLSGVGAATIGINTNVPLLGALGGMTVAACDIGLSGSLASHAIGIMAGTTTDPGITTDSVRDAVWNAILANYPTVGTAGKTLALAGSGGVDYAALAAAVLAAATTTPIASNVKKVNDVPILGTGVPPTFPTMPTPSAPGDPFRVA